MQIRKTLGVIVLASAALVVTPTFADHDSGRTHSHKKMKSMKGNSTMRLWNDATRLQALLSDVSHTANFDGGVWKTVGSEALVLSNRIYANSGSSSAARKLARETRTHVREMRNAAMNGDAAGARSHAAMAAPIVNQLVDWSADNAG
ncbi:MAG TPA: hypothetical protein VNM92_12965 [Thermoanaerobaculia bacterium]|nr:hypothetical protein [Thermoanaerobaculia bacterium]